MHWPAALTSDSGSAPESGNARLRLGGPLPTTRVCVYVCVSLSLWFSVCLREDDQYAIAMRSVTDGRRGRRSVAARRLLSTLIVSVINYRTVDAEPSIQFLRASERSQLQLVRRTTLLNSPARLVINVCLLCFEHVDNRNILDFFKETHFYNKL